jgi:hypothetical protein
VGLRSSFELDYEEGRVFVALSADRYPIGVMGRRRNAVGDLFVSRMVACPQDDFAAAVDSIKQRGIALILGSEAKELICKMEQVKGIAPRADFKEIWEVEFKEIWKVENWGEDEWIEQVFAEIGFASLMNVQYSRDPSNLRGRVAGYRVRRAPNGLVLVASDSDEDIFVAVWVERTTGKCCVLGWLRGSEGKFSKFYQKNCCWVSPRKLCTIWKSSPAKKSSEQCQHFKNSHSRPKGRSGRLAPTACPDRDWRFLWPSSLGGAVLSLDDEMCGSVEVEAEGDRRSDVWPGNRKVIPMGKYLDIRLILAW